MANSKSKAAEQAEQAEQALRKLLLNMRNDTKAPHTQALANFKAAVRAYNKAQVNAAKAVNGALGNPTAQSVNRAAGALGNALNKSKRLKRAQALAEQAARTPVNTVPIGNNNFKVTRNNNTGKIVKLEGRGREYHKFGSQNGKNYVQLEKDAWYQLGNTSGQKYNKNKSGRFVKKQGLLGRVGGAVRGVGGAVVGGARATGGALGGLFRPRSRPVKPNSETARLIDEPPPPNKRN